MGRLQGKIAFVTGAGAGIGRASTLMFAREGAKVIAAEIDQAAGKAVEQEARATGSDVTFVHVDVTNDRLVEAAVAKAAELYGGLHVLFNCAGGSIPGDRKVTDVEMDLWAPIMNLEVLGPFLCCKHAIPLIARSGGGAVINVGSAAALKGTYPAHIYSLAKGGLLSFTRALAGSYFRDNIRANVICPGVVMSERIRQRFGEEGKANNSSGASEQAASARPDALRRYPFAVGAPDDIAHIALFLASDESRMVNGAMIAAEGGLSAY